MNGLFSRLMRELSMLGNFMDGFRRYAGTRLWVSLSLIAISGMTQGAGLVLLLPMVNLVGIGGPEGSAALAGRVSEVFGWFGVELALPAVLVAFVVLIAMNALFMMSVDVLNSRLSNGFMHRLRLELYRRVTGMSWGTYMKVKPSDINNALTIETQKIGAATTNMLQLAVMCFMCGVYFAVSLAVSPKVTLVSLACGMALLIVLWPMNISALRAGTGTQRGMLAMFAEIREHINGFKVAKSYGLEDKQVERFSGASRLVTDRIVEFTRHRSLAQMLFQTGAAAFLALLFYYAIAVARLDTASVIVMVFLYSRIMSMFTRAQQLSQQLSNNLPSFRAVRDLGQRLDAGAEDLGGGTEEPMALRESMGIVGLRFAYEHGDDVLRGLNMSIRAGEFLAIVGASGQGKSTFADLVMGLNRPTGGRITVDGAVLDGRIMKAWRQSIGYVPQETFLFDDTLRNNLLWAREDADERELWEALRDASAEEFVRAMPKGLDTMVGDNGVRLSGGERQRIALARALLRKPSLLVLDEPTSNLDQANEANVRAAIERLKGRVTMIVIAHRISTIEKASRVISLENGVAVEYGSWDELTGDRRQRLKLMTPECEAL